MVKKLSILFLLLSFVVKGQKWDTTSYAKYSNRFTLGMFYSYRQCDLTLDQTIRKDTGKKSTINYFAQSASVIGFDMSYDKFSLSFGIKSVPAENTGKIGQTKTFNFGVSVGGTRWIWESYLRSFTGFYDKNTAKYDTTFKKSGVFTQFPNLTSSLFRSKFLIFRNNEHFAYRAPFGCSYRQLRTSASFISGGSYSLFSSHGDSSIIPRQIRQFYDSSNIAHFKGIIVSGITVYFGGSATLVIKKAFFVNLTFIVGPEFQGRQYQYVNSAYNIKKGFISYSGSGGFAMGFNFKKGYFAFANTSDFNGYGKSKINLKSKYLSFCFMFGYRFYTNTPKFYQNFQNTKFYKIF